MEEKKTPTETPIAKVEKKPKKKKETNGVLDGSLIKFEMGATINTGQYENIQPKIELAVSSIEKGTEIAMGYILDLTKRFSINGGLKEKVNATVTAKLKSFNEADVEVDFDAINHTYHYKNAILVGATTFIQKFYKKFDSKVIAKVCANSWEVEQQAIEDMWNGNGSLASTLGTLVDNALEHYDKYFEMGEKIKAKNGKDNPAMPKHPLLKGIIESFHALPHPKGEVKHQVFVSDVANGFCGQLDRIIITGEKKCIIQDFKVNVNSAEEDKNSKALAPFDTLPPNKITKYSLQVNFYREILEKSGWTVEGMEAIVFEDTWKVYPLDVINVINQNNA